MTATRLILAALVPMLGAGSALAQGTPEQRAACGPDAMRLCASVLPDIGKIPGCLQAKREALSTACRTVLDASGGVPQTPAAGGGTMQSTAALTGSNATPDAPAPDTAAPVATAPVASEPVARAPVRAPRSRAQASRQARASYPSARARVARRPAVRGIRREDGMDRDLAEAVATMRRITGYTGPIDFSAFTRIPENFAALTR